MKEKQSVYFPLWWDSNPVPAALLEQGLHLAELQPEMPHHWCTPTGIQGGEAATEGCPSAIQSSHVPQKVQDPLPPAHLPPEPQDSCCWYCFSFFCYFLKIFLLLQLFLILVYFLFLSFSWGCEWGGAQPAGTNYNHAHTSVGPVNGNAAI
jgi:hypothetical protein